MRIFKHTWLWVAISLLLTVLAYWPVFSSGFVNWDDDFYVTGNHLIRSFEHWQTWFSEPFMGLYQPLVLLSLAIDYSILSADPLVFHISNLLLHLLNTFLVFLFLKNLLKSNTIAVIAMLLFGLHPLHVEAVAWVTERKEVLAALFFLLALNSYIQYLKELRTKWLLLTFLAFIFSLLSKASAVTLPLVLILIDFYSERKWKSKSVLFEKLWFFIPALVFGVLTLYWHRSFGSLSNASDFSLLERVFLAGKGIIYYLSKTIWPLDLSPYNQLPASFQHSLIPEIVFYWFLIFIVIFVVVRTASKNRIIFFSVGFFAATLFLFLVPPGVPVLVSERYVYLPSIGLYILIALIFRRYLNRPTMRKVAATILTLYIIFLSVITWQQAMIWKNSLNLWNHVIEVRGALYYPMMQRGNAYRERGDYNAALADFNAAISINPFFFRTYEKRGHLYLLEGEYEKAIEDFNRAINLEPRTHFAHNGLGFAWRKLENFDKALDHLNRSIALEPQNPDAYFNRGKIYLKQGNTEEGCDDLQQALDFGLAPGNGEEARQLISDYCR